MSKTIWVKALLPIEVHRALRMRAGMRGQSLPVAMTSILTNVLHDEILEVRAEAAKEKRK
jgi:plasmid stability protein